MSRCREVSSLIVVFLAAPIGVAAQDYDFWKCVPLIDVLDVLNPERSLARWAGEGVRHRHRVGKIVGLRPCVQEQTVSTEGVAALRDLILDLFEVNLTRQLIGLQLLLRCP